MTNIFLTGVVTDWDNPLGWHDEIRSEYPDYDFTNPYEIDTDADVYEQPEQVMEPAVEAVRASDGVLVHWDDGVSLVGTPIYMREAQREDLPVVVWYSGDRDSDEVSPGIQWLSQHRIYDSREKAMSVLQGLADTDTRFEL